MSMKISTILDDIDSRDIALPEFQRGFVWKREQVRKLMNSLYRGYPVGSVLVWTTSPESAKVRGDGELPVGSVDLLLDGQQRITSLYGILRGRPPEFFQGDPAVFTGLHFHLRDETFEFYAPSKMKGDPLWIDVTELEAAGLGQEQTRLSTSWSRFSTRLIAAEPSYPREIWRLPRCAPSGQKRGVK